MEIDVAQLLKESVGAVRHYRLSDTIDGVGEGEGDCPVQGELELMRTNRSILVSGILETRVKAICSRCLSMFEQPLNFNLEEEYFSKVDVNSGRPLPLPEEPGALLIDEHHILDLSEAVRQHILLALPMKLLCRPDCAGLCPHCGHNLNEGRCHCPPQSPDQRWSDLLALAKGSGNDKERKGS